MRGSAHTLDQLAKWTDATAEHFASAARVVRFLQGHIKFVARPDDVFISSYPRSGTTWLQQILVVLTNDRDHEDAHISEYAPWYERQLALGAQTAEDFANMRSPRIFKSHLPFAWLPKGARYVYALRDGRDVAVSYYHLYCSHLGFQGDFNSFYERFVRGDLQYGSWFKHVAGWRRLEGRPDVRFIEYERMQQDLPTVMNDLADFCGLRLSRERILQLSEFCSFSYMKRHQDRFDHAGEEQGLHQVSTGQFVRQGTTGEFSAYFSRPQLERFEERKRPQRWWAGMEFRLGDFLH